MSHRQSLDFELIRSGQFSPIEQAVLLQVWSHRDFCYIKNLTAFGRSIQRSERTVRRAINSLVAKGVIKKQYCCFKKLKLTLVSLGFQKLLRNGKASLNRLYKELKSLNKKSHRTRYSVCHRTHTDDLKAKEELRKEKGSNDFQKGSFGTNSEQGLTRIGSPEELLAGFWTKFNQARA